MKSVYGACALCISWNLEARIDMVHKKTKKIRYKKSPVTPKGIERPKTFISLGGIPVSTTSAIERELEQMKKERQKKHQQNMQKIERENKKKKEKIEQKIANNSEHIMKISAKDFIVRRNTFKCLHNNHTIQQIAASVFIIDKKGNMVPELCSAGYCKQCNVYFIMESTYQSLKKKGIIACRISDEKKYVMGKAKINGMLLAQESILKQYGYSVSQTDGITESQRRKLLALLIDYHILDKNSIIGYLDFFINQHLDSKFIVAVSKWEKDRDFICKYKNGSFQQIAIKSIKH